VLNLDELEKLAHLKEKGILSQKEFEIEKDKILNSERISEGKNSASFKRGKVAQKNKNQVNLVYKKKADVLGWLIAFSPIYLDILLVLFFGVEVFSNYELYFFMWSLFNMFICSLNDYYVKKAYGTESNWWFLFLVPVYLYKQAKQTNTDLNKFTTWMICFIISVFLFN